MRLPRMHETNARDDGRGYYDDRRRADSAEPRAIQSSATEQRPSLLSSPFLVTNHLLPLICPLIPPSLLFPEHGCTIDS